MSKHQEPRVLSHLGKTTFPFNHHGEEDHLGKFASEALGKKLDVVVRRPEKKTSAARINHSIEAGVKQPKEKS